jgi:membrane-associated protein
MEAFLGSFSGLGVYVGLLLLLILCGVGNPLPEDFALITGGYLAYTEVISFWPTVIICYVGVIIGDLMLYGLGRYYGQKIIAHRWINRIIPTERVEKIRANFRRWGRWTIFLARFLVGLRSPTFLVAGVMHVRFRDFLVLDAIGALITVPLFVGLGLLFGNNIEVLRYDVRHYSHWAMAAGIILLAGWLFWVWWKVRKEDIADQKEKALFRSDS